MHLFQSHNILYLVYHALAGFFLMAGVLGIPGNPGKENKTQKILMNTWGILILVCWKGVPILAVTSILALLFKYDFIGALLAIVNLSLGLCLFVTALLYYSLPSEKE